jgi:uncharacterized OB-fold protein
MSELSIERIMPNLNEKLYAAHFQALNEQKIAVQHCVDCGHSQWPAREICFQCHQTNLVWKDIADSGTVYTYSISYRAFHPWFKKHLPYGIFVVDLGDGIRMLGNCFDEDVGNIECGMKVKAVYRQASEGVTLLEWARVAD